MFSEFSVVRIQTRGGINWRPKTSSRFLVNFTYSVVIGSYEPKGISKYLYFRYGSIFDGI